MQAIHALIAGIRGAESGTARIYARGTTTPITHYTDFEGNGGTTGDVALDASGSATRFVNQLARVVVLSSGGATVRDFVCGETASAVEVKSASFNGAAYSGGAVAPGNPTTLAAVLDKWVTSAGAEDFNVSVAGIDRTLESALSSVSGLRMYVVTDSVYGAVGDGVTNDTAAVNAAIAACAADGGGVVFIPAGVTCLVDTLTTPAGSGLVQLVGAGQDVSTLLLNSTTNPLVSGRCFGKIADLQIQVTGAGTFSGNLINITTATTGTNAFVIRNVKMPWGSVSGTFLRATASVPYADIDGLSVDIADSGKLVDFGTSYSVVLRNSTVSLSGTAAGSLITAYGANIDSLEVSCSTSSGTKTIVTATETRAKNMRVSVVGTITAPTIFSDGAATGFLQEFGVVAPSDAVFYSLSAGTLASRNTLLGSRRRCLTHASPNSDPLSIAPLQHDSVMIQVTSTAGWAGNCQVNLSEDAPPGSLLALSFWNDTGAPITFEWNTNVANATATFAVAANSVRTHLLVCMAILGPKWFLVGTVAGAEVPE